MTFKDLTTMDSTISEELLVNTLDQLKQGGGAMMICNPQQIRLQRDVYVTARVLLKLGQQTKLCFFFQKLAEKGKNQDFQVFQSNSRQRLIIMLCRSFQKAAHIQIFSLNQPNEVSAPHVKEVMMLIHTVLIDILAASVFQILVF